MAAKIDWFCELSDLKMDVQKYYAYQLALANNSMEAVKPLWEAVLAE